MLISAVEILVASYVGICLVVFFSQARLLYYPTRDVYATPRNAGLDYEDLMLKCPSGAEINAWFVPARNARGTLLFCHGNAGNNADRVDSIATFNRLGFNVFIFDYRGYGKSTGVPTEKGTYEDALTAWKYLTEGRAASGKSVIPPENIVIFGRSLGGSVAAWLATQVAPRALIVESAFTSVADMGARLYPWLPVRLLARYRYKTVDYIARAKCPILVAHSPDDEIVPYSLGRRNFDAAPEPKEWLDLSGDHNEGYATMGDDYSKALDRFLTKHFEPKGSHY